MDRGAWWATVHGVAKSRTRLSDFTFTFHFHALEKAMATHSSVLAWRIPGTGEPGGLLSMGSHRVGTRLKRLSSSCSSRSRLKGNKYLFNKSVWSEPYKSYKLQLTLEDEGVWVVDPLCSEKSPCCCLCLKNNGFDKSSTQGQEAQFG